MRKTDRKREGKYVEAECINILCGSWNPSIKSGGSVCGLPHAILLHGRNSSSSSKKNQCVENRTGTVVHFVDLPKMPSSQLI